jgi:3-deoxy-D-manno-octulosonic-acid transferase
LPALIYFLYRLLQVLVSPLIVAYLLWRGGNDKEWLRSMPARFGGLPFAVTAPGGIWLHAVSVGEVMSAPALLRGLRERLPDTPLYVSVSTVAGHALAQQRLEGLADGVFYAPIDACFAVRRVLRAMKPGLVVVLETEIWPNLWRETRRSGARLLVVNARISDRAMPRYRAMSWFFGPVLRQADAIYAQSARDVERYLELGAEPQRVYAGGNLKFDFVPDDASPAAEILSWIEEHAPREIVIAASTMPPMDAGDDDEDDLALAAFQELAARRPGMLWIHVPRRPTRFEAVAQKLKESGIRHTRRTALAEIRLPGVLLLDTIGELNGLFPLADVVFMGGTLVRRGGHNILEPAFAARTVIAGPHMENFAEIAELFTREGALIRIENARDLSQEIRRWLDDPDARERTGRRAKELAASQRGATQLAVAAAAEWLEESWLQPLHTVGARILLTPFVWLWRWGARRDQAKQLRGSKKLMRPVVCVGGMTMGGSGKTPMVLHLASHFRAMGKMPAILTRGYKRLSPEKYTVLPAGGRAPVSLTGDEAQIFVRSAIAHLGIGGDRVKVGEELLRQLPADLILLDDGYQHRRLQRDFDLLLLDAQNPVSAGQLFPLGRLREPVSGIGRADAIVLTRTQRGREYRQLLLRLRQWNPRAPIFRSQVRPEAWVEYPAGTAQELELGLERVAAFCGLGVPAAFWAVLRRMGIRTCFRWSFGDHHQYRPWDLKRLQSHALEAGAEALLTTEKDVMNLPDNAEQLLAPLRLFWLRIGLSVEGEEELLAIIRDRIFGADDAAERADAAGILGE